MFLYPSMRLAPVVLSLDTSGSQWQQGLGALGESETKATLSWLLRVSGVFESWVLPTSLVTSAWKHSWAVAVDPGNNKL